MQTFLQCFTFYAVHLRTLDGCKALGNGDHDTTVHDNTQVLGDGEGDLALMGEGRLKLSYLSADAQLLSGDVVTTSGLGGFYPGGLVIGTVESVRTGDDGLAQYAVLAPAARLGELSEVFIIKDFDIVD